MIFTELGRLFILRSDNELTILLENSTTSFNSTVIGMSPSAHTIHKAMDMLKHSWELTEVDGKDTKEGKLWFDRISSNTHFH